MWHMAIPYTLKIYGYIAKTSKERFGFDDGNVVVLISLLVNIIKAKFALWVIHLPNNCDFLARVYNKDEMV
jgi:hypothetical protein